MAESITCVSNNVYLQTCVLIIPQGVLYMLLLFVYIYICCHHSTLNELRYVYTDVYNHHALHDFFIRICVIINFCIYECALSSLYIK